MKEEFFQEKWLNQEFNVGISVWEWIKEWWGFPGGSDCIEFHTGENQENGNHFEISRMTTKEK